MNSFQIRQAFLTFFEERGHTIVPSSSLIPAEDPTILFTNAGMNQFKDVFLGKEKRSYTRATSAQKCVRAGGKHNDLDIVGFTERHLTFFEMLGNFSFGDYFKKEAITYAWEFLTQSLHLPANLLYISVYKDDQESYDIWHKTIGVPENRIVRLGQKDNFWQMGDTGPCGPCTEIYFDRGEHKGCKSTHCMPSCDCSRFIEIWNNVFMQYNRQSDGNLQVLTNTGVDTGMGLERLSMVIQGKDNVFQTDILKTLINYIEDLITINYQSADQHVKGAFHVLADHVRTCCLLIADGCTPSNDGRGYVLRKIIRRAALFASKISDDIGLFPTLAKSCITLLSPIFKELEASKSLIINLLTQEIQRFHTNLLQGQHILDQYIDETKKTSALFLPGDYVFKLYDTYGFPPEITRVLAQEKGLTIDMDGFTAEMQKQQEQSGKKNNINQKDAIIVAEHIATMFVGYNTTEIASTVLFVKYDDDHNSAWIITEHSPFYVECGGQVSDTGTITINNITYNVIDLKKVVTSAAPAIAAKIAITPEMIVANHIIQVGDEALCTVDPIIRANTVKNHTATHLLQAALLQILGPQIKQAGSLVNDHYLRFDFTHHAPLTKQEIHAIEQLVNQKIMENIQTTIFNTTLDDAKKHGVIAFFGEKYNPENVRVVQVPGFSAELCGGTHATNTGTIGCFKITSESALSSGIRRINAVTGQNAITLFDTTHTITKELSEEFKIKTDEIIPTVQKLITHYHEAQSAIKQLKKQLYKKSIIEWVATMQTINTIPTLVLFFDDVTTDELKIIAQELEKIKPGFYLLITNDKATNKYSYLGYVATTLEQKVPLKKCAELLQKTYNWRGGGNNSSIQGGGITKPENIQALITQALTN